MLSVWSFAILVTSLALAVQSADVTNTKECEPGWIYHVGRCFLMRDEYETFENARETCGLFGAALAYADDQNTLKFLFYQIKHRVAYGWWYGTKIKDNGEVLVINEDGYYDYPQYSNNLPVPNRKQHTSPVTSCVGLVRDKGLYTVEYFMRDVPCQITLPYACRGDPKKVTVPINDNHFVKNSTQDVFYYSDPTDMRSYDDATKACSAMDMTLLSARDDPQMKNITRDIEFRQDYRVEPWWIGLQVKKGLYTWTSGVYMQDTLVNWDRKSNWETFYISECNILLTDGTMDGRMCYSAKAPFICSRETITTGKFGCPVGWMRGGQSCYIVPAGQKRSWVTCDQAEKTCAKLNSHPISIDTPIEKLWVRKAAFGDVIYKDFWTSLSDKKRPGHFVWADGSAPKTSIVKWSVDEYYWEGNCFSFNTQSHELWRKKCEYDDFPGCQYKPKNGQCVSTDWQYYKGNCYYIPKTSDLGGMRRPYQTQLHVCYADVSKYDNSINISPLKVESKDLMDLYKDMDDYGIWIGLKKHPQGLFQWADGTAANVSIFSKGSMGTDNSTRKCAVMGFDGQFKSKSCSTCTCGVTICEKEVTYHVDKGNGCANIMPSYLCTQLLMTICSFFLVYRIM